MSRQKIKISLLAPEHGWLPFSIRSGDFEYEDAVSCSPDPITWLSNALVEVLKDLSSQAYWQLEECELALHFEKAGDTFQVKISQEFHGAPGIFLHQIEGTLEEVILPFYRMLKNFYSLEHSDPHWPKIDNPYVRLNELTNLINEHKWTQQ